MERPQIVDCYVVTSPHTISRVGMPLPLLERLAEDLQNYQMENGVMASFTITSERQNKIIDHVDGLDVWVPLPIGLYLETIAMGIKKHE